MLVSDNVLILRPRKEAYLALLYQGVVSAGIELEAMFLRQRLKAKDFYFDRDWR